MLPVKIRIRIYHLRLDPDPELKSPLPYAVRQALHPAGQFFLIGKPVSERRIIVIPLSKPSVIHHEHLYSQAGRLLGNAPQFLGIEIKICSFPVIDQNGAFPVTVPSPDQMPAVQIMKISRHPANPVRRIHENGLWCRKRLPRS